MLKSKLQCLMNVVGLIKSTSICAERYQILRSTLSTKFTDFEIREVATKAHGYTPGDLTSLARHAVTADNEGCIEF